VYIPHQTSMGKELRPTGFFFFLNFVFTIKDYVCIYNYELLPWKQLKNHKQY